MTGRRAEDSGRVAAWWGRWGRDVTTAIAVALAAWSVWTSQHEGAQRRDQLCVVFERQEVKDIEALRQTYAYLAGLKPAQFREPLNRAVLANLPKAVSDAKTPDAPVYCNERGVGLPEPGPAIPRPPKNLPRLPKP